MLIFAFREYGAIDDVDIDLHIDVSFLDVSINLHNIQKPLFYCWKKLNICFSYILSNMLILLR